MKWQGIAHFWRGEADKWKFTAMSYRAILVQYVSEYHGIPYWAFEGAVAEADNAVAWADQSAATIDRVMDDIDSGRWRGLPYYGLTMASWLFNEDAALDAAQAAVHQSEAYSAGLQRTVDGFEAQYQKDMEGLSVHDVACTLNDGYGVGTGVCLFN